jgi:hypothetical protein
VVFVFLRVHNAANKKQKAKKLHSFMLHVKANPWFVSGALNSKPPEIHCPTDFAAVELATGKSPEPAGWKACPTSFDLIPAIQLRIPG